MKISVLHNTTDFRGDHSTDVVVAYDLDQNETVTHLIERILYQNGKCVTHNDYITLRVIREVQHETI